MESVKQKIDRYIGEIKDGSSRFKSELDYLYEISKGKSKIYVDAEKLEQLFFEAEDLFRTVESLEFANKLLYQNRGKASVKKSVSSKINGTKGGRPPKEISLAKKKLDELDIKWARGEITDEETMEQTKLRQIVRDWENKKMKNLNK